MHISILYSMVAAAGAVPAGAGPTSANDVSAAFYARLYDGPLSTAGDAAPSGGTTVVNRGSPPGGGGLPGGGGPLIPLPSPLGLGSAGLVFVVGVQRRRRLK